MANVKMEEMVKKTCPMCGEVNYCYSDEQKKQIHNNAAPKNKALKYVFDLWHHEYDFCAACNYCTLDFRTITNANKILLKSKEFLDINQNETLYKIEGLVYPTFVEQLNAGFFAKESGNHFLASGSYFSASGNLYADVLQYAREIIRPLNKSEQQVVDYCHSFSEKLSEQALTQIDLEIKKNASNIDCYMLKILLLFYSEKHNEAFALWDYVKNNLPVTQLHSDAFEAIKKSYL